MDIQVTKEYKKVGNLKLPSGFLFCAHHRLLRATNVTADTWIGKFWSSPTASLLCGILHPLLKLLDDCVPLKALVWPWLLRLTTLLRNQSDLALVSFYLVPVNTACLSHVKLPIIIVWYFDKDIPLQHLLYGSLQNIRNDLPIDPAANLFHNHTHHRTECSISTLTDELLPLVDDPPDDLFKISD